MAKKDEGKKVQNKKESSIVTKESICSTCALFALLVLLVLCTRSLIFGEVGETIHIFFTGIFGYFAYPVVVGVLYLSVMGLLDKRLVKNRRLAGSIIFAVIFAALIVHGALTYSWGLNTYVKKCFLAGTTFPKTTVCGALGGLLIYGVASLTTKSGAIVLFSLLMAFSVFLCYVAVKKSSVISEKKEEKIAEEKTVPVKATTVESVEKRVERSEETPSVSQRPGVSLSGADNATLSEGFSPFGVPQTTAESDMEVPYGSREFLFGGSPAENFRRNLIFDPNARVNTRPSEETSIPVRDTAYTPSYSGAYETSMNREEPLRPAKVVSDYSGISASSYKETEEKSATSYAIEETLMDTHTEVEKKEPIEKESYLDYTDETTTREETVVDYTDRGREESVIDEQPKEEMKDEPYRRHEYMDLFSPSNPRVFGDDGEPTRFGEREERESRAYDEADTIPEEKTRESQVDRPRDGISLFDDDDPYTLRTDYEEEPRARERSVAETRGRGEEFYEEETRVRSEEVYEEETRGRVEESFEATETRGREEVPVVEKVEPPKPVEQPKPEPPKPRVIKPYKRVPLDDFDCRDIEPTANQEEVEYTKENILATLEEFKITGASIASVTFGPTVTRYNVTIPRSISPKKVVALDASIAISLHSSGVSIYPNYEDGVVSIEVPNKERQFVQLGCMLSGDTFVNAKSSSIMFAMGKDVANRKVYGDITKMVHLLVAGSTNSGKSVFLGALIISLIYKYSPEELRLILIDPKKTEFVLYNDLPHLMINEIITDAGKSVQALNWAVGEMNRRYGLFEKMSRSGTYVVNLDQYNEQLEKAERLPKIVIIIDELADLMLSAKKEIEDRIQSLTQKARAAGIHLIVATQRPSTDVITGVIKSNLPTRIAFSVATDVDSRVILDQTGAQKLLGKGDFLYTMPGINTPVRVQSAFISPEDSQRVVTYIKNNNEAYYDEEATAYINSRGGNGGTPSDPFDSGNGGDNVDPMFIEALRYVILSNSASISMIQRKCSAGYNRAGKIIEWMEDMGYISPFDGAKARKVLITKEEFESKYGPLDK